MSFAHPALSTRGEPAGVIVVERATNAGRAALQSTLVFFRPAVPESSVSDDIGTPLPGIVNRPGADTTRPAFSDDGRYLAFLSFKDDLRLFVWDTDTQLLLNPDGIPVGGSVQNLTSRQDGAIALFPRPVIVGTAIKGSEIQFALLSGSSVGIIVQRVVGRTRVLGRRAPKLKLVGRVPLGQFRKGRRHVRWNRRVNGKRLRRGEYLVTVRSVARRLRVRDLGKPMRCASAEGVALAPRRPSSRRIATVALEF